MLTRLRQQFLLKIFGPGAGSFLAASAVGWLIDNAKKAFGENPETLDVSRLKPGESYLVTTRPPMSKAERKLQLSRDKLDQAIARQTRPNASTRKVATQLSKTQRKLSKAKPGSSRAQKYQARSDALGDKFDALTAPNIRVRSMQSARAELDLKLAEARVRSLASAKKPPRATTTKRFR
ncbi:MAG TPA: hypothetical protein DEG43_07955 [Acidimicrobiaceae bacterium]|nr:hypothetical protein [Acidimicrobiaceae bacterium]